MKHRFPVILTICALLLSMGLTGCGNDAKDKEELRAIIQFFKDNITD
jgi:hypothetical protein